MMFDAMSSPLPLPSHIVMSYILFLWDEFGHERKVFDMTRSIPAGA